MIHRKMVQRMHTGDEGKVKNLLSAKQTRLQNSPTCHILILKMEVNTTFDKGNHIMKLQAESPF